MSSGLNSPQREAIRYLDGPLLVLAGAGSGKTRVITQKIAHLVEQCGMEPRHIAAITFTNKAAKEMAERVAKLMPGKGVGQLNVSTFHSLGVRILRAEAKLLGLKPQFSILDAADAMGILAELSKESDKARLRQLGWKISQWKNAMLAPESAASHAGDELELLASRVYAEYERTLRAYQAVDFDDLIGVPVKLFDEHPEARERWQGRLRYLLVDEYQDTNRSQYQLLRQLAGPRAAFTAVGDDDQAIYAWRGADVENLRNLQRDYPRLKVIKLEQNYRSTGRILHAANTLIANNEKLFEKKLWSEFGHGEPVEVRGCRDPEDEAQTVAMKIAAHKRDPLAAQVDQVRDALVRALEVVHNDRVVAQVADRAVDQDDRRPKLRELLKRVARDAERRREDQPHDALGHHHPDIGVLFGGTVAGVAQQDVQLIAAGQVVDPAHDGREVGVVDVGDDHTEDFTGRATQAADRALRLVAQGLDGLHHTLPQRLGHAVVTVDDARDGRFGDARVSRHILKRHGRRCEISHIVTVF
jgi:ATP-dependent exoDNAse (exonuclease V) beta subunit